MKGAVLVAAAAPLALAQSLSTETYTSCTSGPGVTVTSTGTKTMTEPCTMAECTGMGGGSGSPRSGTVHTTIWTTVYTMLCPTGAEERTVTVTESCSSATPTWSMNSPGYMPPSWTTGMVTCNSCGPAPTSAMLTYPASAVSNGTPAPVAPPATSEARSGSGPAPSAPAPAPAPPAGSAPAPAPPAGSAPAPAPPAGSAPAPAPPAGSAPEGSPLPTSTVQPSITVSSTVTVAPMASCPGGKDCPAESAPAGSGPAATPAGECTECEGSSTTPASATYTGAASNNKAAWYGLSTMLIVAGGAFLL